MPPHGKGEAESILKEKARRGEERAYEAAKAAPFIAGLQRRCYKQCSNRPGRKREGNSKFFVYNYWCDLCGDDLLETIPVPCATQISDHAAAHDTELITIWKRAEDGMLFSDHFVGGNRQDVNLPWAAATSTFQWVRNIFPDSNLS